MKPMSTLFLIMLLFTSLPSCKEVRTRPAGEITTPTASSIYDIKLKTIDGKDTTLSAYRGKKMLLVNVASNCGYTPQYTELEQLWKQYGDKVVVLGFPANNFLGQEPGTN